ncbi:MAG: hypothetical protein JWO82_4289 [Akkermansiaceae bacterium]|nr:hypothetical protein [Akkermansiaceae bacterium]
MNHVSGITVADLAASSLRMAKAIGRDVRVQVCISSATSEVSFFIQSRSPDDQSPFIWSGSRGADLATAEKKFLESRQSPLHPQLIEVLHKNAAEQVDTLREFAAGSGYDLVPQKATRFKIVDKPGAIWVATMVRIFENCIRGTPIFAKRLKLERRQEAADQFAGYTDDETDILWTGFAIGLRCAQRFEKQGISPSEY